MCPMAGGVARRACASVVLHAPGRNAEDRPRDLVSRHAEEAESPRDQGAWEEARLQRNEGGFRGPLCDRRQPGQPSAPRLSGWDVRADLRVASAGGGRGARARSRGGRPGGRGGVVDSEHRSLTPAGFNSQRRVAEGRSWRRRAFGGIGSSSSRCGYRGHGVFDAIACLRCAFTL